METNDVILPAGWEWSTLSDVCQPSQYGWTTSASSTGKLHLLRTTDISSGSIDWDTVPFCSSEPTDIDKYLLQDGDIVISRAGSVGFSYLIKNPKRAVFASYLIRFRPLINEKYVSYFLQSPDYWQAISERSLGIAIPNVNATKLSQISIPLPPSHEQERIVERIESLFTQLDAGVARLKRAQAALKRYKASVLKAACEGHLVTQDPSDESAEELLRQLGKSSIVGDELTPLPQMWCWAKLGDISKRITDGTHQPPKFESTGIHFLFVKHVVSGKISFEDTRYISEKTYSRLQARCPVEVGDVLYTAVGSYGVAIPVQTSRPFSFQRHIAHIKPLTIISTEYLSIALNSDVGKKQANQYARGVAQKTVTLGDLTRYIIPLPPVAEQHRIIAEVERRLSVVQELEQTIEANLKRAGRLRQAILKRAFEGRLL